jgi:8-oxo-dGTP pyrophosphatase MutT (NUDIX family)
MLEKRLRSALELDLPYGQRPPFSRPQGTQASVLVLFGEKNGEPSLLLTRRTEKVETHKGQIAFPGGKCEAEELVTSDGIITAALRETEEEVGLSREAVRVLGRLPVLWTPTGFLVTPVVGMLSAPAESFGLSLNELEIAEVRWIPLSVLSREGTYRRETYRLGAIQVPIDVFVVDAFRIWGATGSMIKNLLDRLAALG